ncbi:MAG: hypothetical protein GF416_07270 [Candidatus Altiarchaeales archaeon]|nr:hypothetical protein [Candidatus Altiarchaeales archaeon]MBD3416912.1 hypothetical protein [Candidatus Altiarchaeales archaeon]
MADSRLKGKRVAYVDSKENGSFMLSLRSWGEARGEISDMGLPELLERLESDSMSHRGESRVVVLGPSLSVLRDGGCHPLSADFQHAYDADEVYARRPDTGRLNRIIVDEERLGSSVLKTARWATTRKKP